MGSRTINSIRNMSVSLFQQILTIILKFISRSIFIHILGNEILGLNSILLEIIGMLSLVDMGLGTAIIYSYYKPLSLNQKSILAALTQYTKKLYTIIAGIVLVIGLSLVPFLKYIVNLDKPIDMNQIYMFYLIALFGAVLSYISTYRSNMIIADQKQYVISMYTMITDIICMLLQIAAMVLTHSYLLFLIIQDIRMVSINLLVARRTKKLYPFLESKCVLDKSNKREITRNIKSMFIYKLSSILFNSTDNIIISVLIGTIYSGFYSTYMLIIHNFVLMIEKIFQSVIASVGNLNQNASLKKQENIFSVMLFISHWIGGCCSICILSMIQEFIVLFAGKESLFSFESVIALVVLFYINSMTLPVNCFREAIGIFNKTKFIILISAVINIVLSIILGKLIGLPGIFIATIIAKLFTLVWYEPAILYKCHFKEPMLKYFVNCLKYLLIDIVLCVLVLQIPIHAETWFLLVVKGIVNLGIICTVYLLIFHKTGIFLFIQDKLVTLIKERRSKSLKKVVS